MLLLLQLVCLANNVYFEARSEPIEGQLAVAEVTLNRVLDERFPDTICEVVHEGGEYKYQCQFTWYCDGKPDTIYNNKAWNKAFDVALAYTVVKRSDITGGALYYHSDKVAPTWANNMEHITTIGNHLFYAPKL